MKELYFWTGPMYSGKTTAMLDMAGRFARSNKVVIVRPQRSGRAFEGDDEGFLVSKAGRRLPCLNFDALSNCLGDPRVEEADVIGIDELGIFEDVVCLLPAVRSLLHTKTVLISGLVNTSEYMPWGSGVSDVWAIADHGYTLKADCESCGTMGIASRTLHVGSDKKSGVVKVGGEESYVAICPLCWSELIKIEPDSKRRIHMSAIRLGRNTKP